MTRLAVSLGALTERIDVLKTAKMAKNATLLTFTGPSFGLFALFEVTEFGSETDRTQRGCELVALRNNILKMQQWPQWHGRGSCRRAMSWSAGQAHSQSACSQTRLTVK